MNQSLVVEKLLLSAPEASALMCTLPAVDLPSVATCPCRS